MLYNSGGEITRMNETARKLLAFDEATQKLPAAQRLQMLAPYRMDGTDYERVEDLPFARALRGQYVYQEVMAFHNPALHDDSPTYISVTTSPIRSSDGTTVGAVVTFSDITSLRLAHDTLERKVAERTAELSTANEALRYQAHLLANVHDAIIATDQDGVVTAWNPAAETLYGWSSEEVIGRPMSALITGQTPVLVQDQILESVAIIGHWRGETLQARRDGTTFVSDTTSVALRDEEDHVVGYVMVNRDISQRKRAEEALKVRVEQQAAVAKLGQRALAVSDLQSLMAEAVSMVSQTLDVPLTKVLRYLPDRDALVLEAGSGWPSDLIGKATVGSGTKSQAGYALASVEPVIVTDARRETRFTPSPLLSERGIVSGISVIIEGQPAPYGVLSAHSTESRTFTEDDIHFLQAVAHDLAAAIQRREAEQVLRHYITRLEIMRRIDRAILSTQSPARIAQAALHDTRQSLIPCQQASVLLFDLENDQATRLAIDSELPTQLEAGQRVALSALGDINELRAGRPKIVTDIETMRHPTWLDRQVLAEGLRAYMAVPLISKNELKGCLTLRASHAHAFTVDQAKIVRQVADPLAIAIQNAQLLDEVRLGRTRLRSLMHQLVTAQENERRRVSRELHDEAGQSLTALKISLELMQADPSSSQKDLRQAAELATETLEQIRLLAQDLRPPELDTIGLNLTLEDFCQEFSARTRIAIDYSGMELASVPDAVSIVFYRVLQEALANVAKHAQAKRVKVSLDAESAAIRLMIEDDGQGFDLSQPRQGRGIGLVGMRERVEQLTGRLELTSHPGRGTRLVAYVPLQEAL